MSDPSGPSAPELPSKPPVTGGGGVFLVMVGTLLLVFPGGCSLVALLSVLADMGGSRGGELDLTSAVYLFSGVGLAVAALGFFLIRFGLRRRRPSP